MIFLSDYFIVFLLNVAIFQWKCEKKMLHKWPKNAVFVVSKCAESEYEDKIFLDGIFEQMHQI